MTDQAAPTTPAQPPLSRRARLTALVGATAAALLIGTGDPGSSPGIVPQFEGTILKTYKDPVGIVTACTGHVDTTLRMGQTFTRDECTEMLAGDVLTAAKGVQDCVTEPMTPGELAGYTSFAFNAGVKAFCSSTAARLLNAGQHLAACAQLSLWVKARGVTLPGLVKRRAVERKLCEQAYMVSQN